MISRYQQSFVFLLSFPLYIYDWFAAQTRPPSLLDDGRHGITDRFRWIRYQDSTLNNVDFGSDWFGLWVGLKVGLKVELGSNSVSDSFLEFVV